MRRQCELLGLSRSSLYSQPAAEAAENLRLMRLIDQEYTAHPFLGSRRLTQWLIEQGEAVNRKRVQQTEPYREIGPMMTTTYEKGKAEGVAEGMAKGLRRSVRLLLERRFGPLSPAVLQRLEAWPTDRLEELLLAVPEAASLQELRLEDSSS
jgi:putative transposase